MNEEILRAARTFKSKTQRDFQVASLISFALFWAGAPMLRNAGYTWIPSRFGFSGFGIWPPPFHGNLALGAGLVMVILSGWHFFKAFRLHELSSTLTEFIGLLLSSAGRPALLTCLETLPDVTVVGARHEVAYLCEWIKEEKE